MAFRKYPQSAAQSQLEAKLRIRVEGMTDGELILSLMYFNEAPWNPVFQLIRNDSVRDMTYGFRDWFIKKGYLTIKQRAVAEGIVLRGLKYLTRAQQVELKPGYTPV